MNEKEVIQLHLKAEILANIEKDILIVIHFIHCIIRGIIMKNTKSCEKKGDEITIEVKSGNFHHAILGIIIIIIYYYDIIISNVKHCKGVM